LPADLSVLAGALDRMSVDAMVRADGALAILVPRDPRWFPDAAARAELVRAAREAGFANVAVELSPGPVDSGASPP
jgi:hypothetical protein